MAARNSLPNARQLEQTPGWMELAALHWAALQLVMAVHSRAGLSTPASCCSPWSFNAEPKKSQNGAGGRGLDGFPGQFPKEPPLMR